MNRKLYRFAVDIFVDKLNKLQQRKRLYKCNDADVSSWNAWLDYNKRNKIPITETYVRKFIEYGMHSWFNEDITWSYRQNVRFSWIFGTGAITRWNKMNAKGRSYCIHNNSDKKIILQRKHNSSTRLTNLLKAVRPIEEKFKNEYLNTRRGLLWCRANTTLYNHKSSTCTICENKDECKSMLKINMPNVYKLRGYK